jgi:capsular polysaccharide biosynthesis protein
LLFALARRRDSFARAPEGAAADRLRAEAAEEEGAMAETRAAYPQVEASRTSASAGALRRWAVRHLPSWIHPLARQAVFTGTAAAGTVLRALPGTSKTFGPPRRIAPTLRHYAERHPGTCSYRELYPEHELRRAPPIFWEEKLHPLFVEEMRRRAWATGVGVIRNGRVVTSSGAIIGPDDSLVYDVSHTASNDDPREHPIFLERKLPAVERFEGSVAVLTTLTSNVPQMYYFVHWLLDTLPRLHLLEKSGVAWDRLVAPQATRFQRETLSLLGVPADRIVSGRDRHIEAASLVVPTLPGLPVNPPKWACDYLRGRFIPMALAEGERPLAPGRRLYFSRAKAKTRQIANEAELLAAIEPLGFERIFMEDYSFLEQVRILQETSIAIAPHGAANAGLVFCNPGTAFLEMFSPKYVNVCYWSLCNQIGARYAYVLGEGKPGGRDAHANIVAPIPKLLRALDELQRVSP